MPLTITAAGVDGPDLVWLDYAHPFMLGAHRHHIYRQAVLERCVLYDVEPTEALEQIILEGITMHMPDVDRDRLPTKAERLAAAREHGPVIGLRGTLDVAGVQLAGPDPATVQQLTDQLASRHDLKLLEQARGATWSNGPAS